MINILQNAFLEVKVSSHGAELQNIISKTNNIEYLWQGDAFHWARRSPVLFPIVGALKDGYFKVGSDRYTMGQHGIARDMEFELMEATESVLSYELNSSEETLQIYPFEFSLNIRYVLKKNQVNIEYLVRNSGAKELLFSIGAHPAFNCPLYTNENRNEYSLVFEKPESASRQLIVAGIRSGEKKVVMDNETILPISDDLFNEDALIFENLYSNFIAIQKGNKPILTMNFDGFPYFGIWSKSSSSPFVCLEPWYGIADHQDHDHLLLNKEGIITLHVGKSFKASYAIAIH